jgi:alpha-L-rhamnosidase
VDPPAGGLKEAGLTRRYTNSAQPGGWFELDLRVPAGEPFTPATGGLDG